MCIRDRYRKNTWVRESAPIRDILKIKPGTPISIWRHNKPYMYYSHDSYAFQCNSENVNLKYDLLGFSVLFQHELAITMMSPNSLRFEIFVYKLSMVSLNDV